MMKKYRRSRLGVPPPERAVGQQPLERGVKPPPNPRKPRLVPDVHGNELRDLFEFFPDLPWPRHRRAARVPARRRGPR